MHLDEFYAVNPTESSLCHSSQKLNILKKKKKKFKHQNETESLHFYGSKIVNFDFLKVAESICDSPLVLISSALESLQDKKFDFVLWTGIFKI